MKLVSAILLSALCLEMSPPGFAQNTATQDANTSLDEIIVTAQRRTESVQKAPIAISVVTAEQLQNADVNRPEDLQQLVPGLSVFRAFGGMNNIYVRGIGAQIANAFGDESVAQSLDGVYVARGTALSGAFLDAQRVEILKGPQGTLYGRNATGGAINYISNKPGFDDEGGMEAQFGNYKDIEVKGFQNIPLSSTLAMRAAIGYIKHDGYIESSDANDQDTLAGRLSFNFVPSDSMSLLVIADYSQDKGNGTGEVVLDRTADHARAVTGDAWSGPPIGNYAPANYNGVIQNPGVGCTLFPGPNQCVPPNTVTYNPNLYGPGKGGYALNPNTVGRWAPGLNFWTIGIGACHCSFGRESRRLRQSYDNTRLSQHARAMGGPSRWLQYLRRYARRSRKLRGAAGVGQQSTPDVVGRPVLFQRDSGSARRLLELQSSSRRPDYQSGLYRARLSFGRFQLCRVHAGDVLGDRSPAGDRRYSLYPREEDRDGAVFNCRTRLHRHRRNTILPRWCSGHHV